MLQDDQPKGGEWLCEYIEYFVWDEGRYMDDQPKGGEWLCEYVEYFVWDDENHLTNTWTYRLHSSVTD